MTRIATWPAATATDNKIADIRAYYSATVVTLADGTVIRPTLKTAKQVVDCAWLLAPMAMVVEPGSWR